MQISCPNCGNPVDSMSVRCGRCGQPLTATSNPFAGSTPNPYAAPTSMGQHFSPPAKENLAPVSSRILAYIIDALLNLAAGTPGGILMAIGGITSGDDEPGALFYVGAALALIGSLALNIYQWIHISSEGQSLGKRWMGVRIVKIDTRQPPGFVNGVILRIWVNSILCGLPCGMGLIYLIVDVCFLFREDRRCVHDLLASTMVVEA